MLLCVVQPRDHDTAATSKIMAQCFRLSFSLRNRRFHSTRAAQQAEMMGTTGAQIWANRPAVSQTALKLVI